MFQTDLYASTTVTCHECACRVICTLLELIRATRRRCLRRPNCSVRQEKNSSEIEASLLTLACQTVRACVRACTVPWGPEGHSASVPPICWVRAQKGRHSALIVGDGHALCKPLGDWSKRRFEVTTPNLIGCRGSLEGSKANDFRKGLLFLCFREPNCLLSSLFFSQTARRKMVRVLQLVLNVLREIFDFQCYSQSEWSVGRCFLHLFEEM